MIHRLLPHSEGQLDGVALGLWISVGVGAGAAVAFWALDRPSAKASGSAAQPLLARIGPTGIRLEGAF